MNHTCPVPGCGATFRSGSKAVVLTSSGEMSTRLVCPKCAARAVALVPPQLAAVPCGQCGKPASVCAACSNDAAQKASALIVKPFADYFRKQAKAYELAGDDRDAPNKAQAKAIRAGRVLGLVQAAETLEMGAGRVVNGTHHAPPHGVGTGGALVDSNGHAAAAARGWPGPDMPDAFEVTPSPELVAMLKRGERIAAVPVVHTSKSTIEGVFKDGPGELTVAISGIEMRPLTAPLEPKSARVLLTIIAERARTHRPPASRRELAVFAKYTRKGSNMRNGLGALRTAGYIEGPQDQPTITGAGVAAQRALGYPMGPAQVFGPELVDEWKRKLKGIPARMLDALVSYLPHEPSREILARELGIEPDCSSYRNGVGRLRTLGLVSKGGLALSPELAAGWQS